MGRCRETAGAAPSARNHQRSRSLQAPSHLGQHVLDVEAGLDQIVLVEVEVAVAPAQRPLLAGFRVAQACDRGRCPLRPVVRTPGRTALQNGDGPVADVEPDTDQSRTCLGSRASAQRSTRSTAACGIKIRKPRRRHRRAAARGHLAARRAAAHLPDRLCHRGLRRQRPQPSQISLRTDNVFRDGVGQQMALVEGVVIAGFTASLALAV